MRCGCVATYSNLENHPKIIRAREVTSQKKGPKIRLHPKTGLPIVEEEKIPSSRRQVSYPDEDDTDESDVGSQGLSPTRLLSTLKCLVTDSLTSTRQSGRRQTTK